MKFLSIFLVSLVFISCSSSQNSNNLEQIDKKSAREVTLKTITKGDSVLHITIQNIWYNGERITAKSDTLITPVNPKTWGDVDTSKTLSKVPIYVTVQ